MRTDTAVVTGASSGIGEAFARQLAAGGAGLVLVARDEQRLRRLADELSASHGTRAEVLPADLRDAEDLARVEKRLDSDEPVDLLVSNAGYMSYGDFAAADLEEELGQVDLHVTATLRLTHAHVRALRRRGARGGVVTLGSTAALFPGAGLATYAATKAFLVSFSESLAEELRPHGITVTCVCPGFTRTELQPRADADMSHLPGPAWQSPDAVARESLVAHRRGRPLVVPGVLNRALVRTSRVTPRAVTRRLTARVLGRR